MKTMTIKLKITLWFTSFIILLAIVIFVFIAMLSKTTSVNQIKAALTDVVDKNAQEIEYEDGRLEIDDDFVSYKNGIYCLVFLEDGRKASGYSPYRQLEEGSFADGQIDSVTIDGEVYLVYDKLVNFSGYEDVWLRGIVSENGSPVTSSAVSQAILTALLPLVILAAVGGYLIACRSFQPIKKISATADAIGSSGDLSKRIELADNGDELNQLAATFNHMFERLETNFEAERHFTSDASHELRTPVTTILAQCEYAFEHAAGEQELYEAIGAIQKQGYRMTRLIESLLSFTRMEQQTQQPEFEMINLSQTVSLVCQEQKELMAKNIVLTADIEPDISQNGDAALLIRMLENLIQNACRYGCQNGHIQVKLQQTQKQVILSVADDGIGMEKEELPKIWNRFYRIDQARTASRGFGLGLAMVEQIVMLHGGNIEVVSKPGRGSTFTVTFFL